jgi:hypothetical protein
MAAHQYATPVPLRTYAPDAPADLEALIAAMLAKTPDGRPASALEVRRRLATVRFDPTSSSSLPSEPLLPAQPAAPATPIRHQPVPSASPVGQHPVAYGQRGSASPAVGNAHAPAHHPAGHAPTYPRPYPP